MLIQKYIDLYLFEKCTDLYLETNLNYFVLPPSLCSILIIANICNICCSDQSKNISLHFIFLVLAANVDISICTKGTGLAVTEFKGIYLHLPGHLNSNTGEIASL